MRLSILRFCPRAGANLLFLKRKSFFLTKILIILCFFSIFGEALASSPTVEIPLKINRSVCDDLLINYVPEPDVPFQEGVDVDGNPVESANLAGSVKIKLPDEINIPINIDLGKYYRDSSSKIAQDLSQLSKNQRSIDSTQHAFNSNASTVASQSSKIKDSLKEIELKITANAVKDGIVTADQLKSKFDEIGASLNTITSALSSNNKTTSDALNPLQNNLDVLKNAINNNALEKDAVFIQSSQKLLETNANSIVNAQNNINANQQLTSDTADLLSKVSSLLADQSTQTLLGASASAIQTQLNTARTALTDLQAASSSAALPSDLLNLKQSFSELTATQLSNYNKLDIGARKAEVGVVKVNLNSGKLTFNGQPLSDEENDKILIKCKEIYKSEAARIP